MTPTHTFNVDLTNPGQFLACCGLLELANCLDAGAFGWFDGNQFSLQFKNNSEQHLVAGFTACVVQAEIAGATTNDNDDESSEKSPPLLLGEPFNLRLDWWEDRTAVQAGFKTWGGGQTVLGFFNGMRQHIETESHAAANILRHASPVATPKPFSFDSRLSVLTLIDLGFFPEKSDPTFSPAVEAFTLVGLQRFRPATVELREQYAYSTWGEPLPAAIAAAVAYGLIPALSNAVYKFPFVIRTGGKYKAFGPAIAIRSSTNA